MERVAQKVPQKVPLCVLGSTGSIGTQTLEVAAHLGIRIDALCAQSDIDTLERQIRRFSPRLCGVADEKAAQALRIKTADTACKILSGSDCAAYLAAESDAGTVLNAIIGFAGLAPTLAAVRAGKTLALANKESLVAAGALVTRAVRENGVRLLPVDSEHCAISMCLAGSRKREVKKLILTASGGPFFGKSRAEIENARPADALKHPNWQMGRKITIDSATLVNKGLELIEAMWLFDLPESQIDTIVHRESIVHSMVEYRDNSVIAQLAVPDMRLCIQHALTGGEKVDGLTPALDFSKLAALSFLPVDHETFPGIRLARRAAAMGGAAPCVLNAANEACVDLFLRGKLRFGEIYDGISDALRDVKTDQQAAEQLSGILDADKAARDYIYGRYGSKD